MKILVLAAAFAAAATPALAQTGSGRGAGMLDRLMALDSNGDGAISKTEAEAGRTLMFARLDADRDGYLSEAERSTGGREAGQGLNGADTNADGRLSRAEVMAAPYRGFDRMDANHDDILSADEIERVRTYLGGR